MSAPLSHLDASGRARMVDVGAEEETQRIARARSRLRMSPGDGPKGEVLGIARLAGIQAAKRTGELIRWPTRCRSTSSTSRPASTPRPARSS